MKRLREASIGVLYVATIALLAQLGVLTAEAWQSGCPLGAIAIVQSTALATAFVAWRHPSKRI